MISWGQARELPTSRYQLGTELVRFGPEHLHLGSAAQGVAAQVMLAEHLGDASIIHLRVDGVDDLLSAKVAAQEGRVTPGQTVGLSFDLDAALAFSGDGVLLGA